MPRRQNRQDSRAQKEATVMLRRDLQDMPLRRRTPQREPWIERTTVHRPLIVSLDVFLVDRRSNAIQRLEEVSDPQWRLL